MNSIATFISRLLHPCFLGIGLLLVAPVAYGDAGSVAVSLAVVLLFSLLAVVWLRARTPTRGISFSALEAMTEYLRFHPKDIIVLVLISGLPSAVFLTLVGAPRLSVVVASSLTATALVLAVINLRYRASYHVAAVTSLALVSAVFWEATFPAALAAVPLIAWARHHLGHHTSVQIAVGCVVGAVVSIATLAALNSAGWLPA